MDEATAGALRRILEEVELKLREYRENEPGIAFRIIKIGGKLIMGLTKAQKREQAENRERALHILHDMLRPGDTVYTCLRHVSNSGMSRIITLHAIREGRIENITHLTAAAIGGRIVDNPSYGLRIGGCGFDAGFEAVYSLGRALYPDGFDVSGVGRNGDTSGHDSDGGYALKQAWL